MGNDETPRTEVCTCIWQGFIHKVIFSDVLSDKMAEWGMMRHQGLRSVHVFGKVLSIRCIFSDVLSDKMAEWGMMRHLGHICTCIWQGFIHKGIFSEPKCQDG